MKILTCKLCLIIAILIMASKLSAQVVYTNPEPNVIVLPSFNSTVYFNLDINNDLITDIKYRVYNSWGYFSCSLEPQNNTAVIYSGSYADTVNVNDTIASYKSWSTANLELAGNFSAPSGIWANVSNKFLGVRIVYNNDTLYGWIRMDILSINGVKITIKDYAIDTIPNQYIIAGECVLPIVENLTISDIGNNKNGSDLKVKFEKAIDESKVSEYRIMVVKESESANFNIDSANLVLSGNYLQVLPNGSDFSDTLLSDMKDKNGELVQEFIPYKVFVLSVADGIYATQNSLSLPSNTITLSSPTSSVTNVIASISYLGGDDYNISVSFNKISDESEVLSYRIIFVKSSETSSFNLDSANNVPIGNYLSILPNGSNYLVNLLIDSVKDKNSNPLLGGTNYNIYVLTVADGILTNVNALSLKSNNFNFSFPVQSASYIIAEDVGSSGNSEDLQISFNKPIDESGISEYRIIAVKLNDTVVFNSQTAFNIQPGNYIQVIPNGSNVVVIVDALARDKDSDMIEEHIPYRFYVLSVADMIISNINSLSKKSNIITLSTPNYFKAGQSVGSNVTYTDINPDSSLTAIKSTVSCYIDINNDSINDFIVVATHSSSPSYSSGHTTIESLNNNAVCVDPVTLFPDTLSVNCMINKDLNWKNGLCYINSYFQDMAPGGDYQTGFWSGLNNKYMGLKIVVGQDTLYGWLGISVGYNNFTIRDYAVKNNNVGISTLFFENEYEFYPNPANKEFTVQLFSKTEKDKRIQIMNCLGQEVFSKSITQNKETVDVSQWTKGIYIVKVSANDGIKTGKLIIQ